MTGEIDPDIYGQDLRLSCLADFLEIQAVRVGSSMSQADLADYVKDSGWNQILQIRYVGNGYQAPSSRQDSQEKSRDAARRIFDIVEQRRFILGDRYPFDVSSSRLSYSRERKVYLWFLFVSLVHGLKLPCIPEATKEFEKSVSTGITAMGIPAVTVGTACTGGKLRDRVNGILSNFPELVATLDNAVVSRHRNDGGIDTFGMFRSQRDKRHGQWAVVCQSTVGRSDSWSTKIHEVSPSLWKTILGDRIHPMALFATPHHVPDDYLHSLFQDHERCILDRIRLVNWSPSAPSSYDVYKNALLAMPLDW